MIIMMMIIIIGSYIYINFNYITISINYYYPIITILGFNIINYYKFKFLKLLL